MRVFLSVCLMALALALAPSALARPGGGQNYRAPSRSSSSNYQSSPSTTHYRSASGSTYSGDSSSDGSGGGGGFGLVVLILVVIIVIVAVQASKRGRSQRAQVAVNREAQSEGLTALLREDPSFNAGAFAERTKKTMAKVNDAWCSGNMGPARRFVSDGVYVRFQTQLALLKAQGLKNVMADWSPTAVELVAADADSLWDTVHVRVAAQARDADVPVTLGDVEAKKKAQSSSLAPYEEVWSFVRRRGKKSKDGLPALEGRCPGCGADLPLSEVVRCEFCKAVVNSGEHDWVLAEITQPEEWGATATGDVPGLQGLRARDATVSRQELEDRASVMFWKWIEAQVTGNRAKLDRFCLVKGQPPIGKVDMRQVAVGSSEVRGVASTDDGLDHAHIEINWSAGVAGAEPEGRSLRLVMARAQSATSKRGLSSLDCPNCGGALADSDAIKCTYCGEALSGGKNEWALEQCEPMG
jgi:hypothetical protein